MWRPGRKPRLQSRKLDLSPVPKQDRNLEGQDPETFARGNRAGLANLARG
jgi:hypothetical protein